MPSAIVYYLLCLDKRRDAETRYVGKVGKYRQYSHSSMLSHWLPPLLGFRVSRMWRRYVTELLQPRNSVPSRTEKLEPARSLQNDCLGIVDHRQLLRFCPSTSATRVPGKVGRYTSFPRTEN